MDFLERILVIKLLKMRVISGKLKGKSIQFVKSKVTRPLKDSVKENIFNILTHSNEINIQIENAEVLDLYSGIGSFGIECLSRKANKVTFIEKDPDAVKILKENLLDLSVENQALVLNIDIKDIYENIKNSKFNILFFDPPFNNKSFFNVLKILKKNNNFEQKHVVIIHRERNSLDEYKGYLELISIKKYSRSKIIFGKLN